MVSLKISNIGRPRRESSWQNTQEEARQWNSVLLDHTLLPLYPKEHMGGSCTVHVKLS